MKGVLTIILSLFASVIADWLVGHPKCNEYILTIIVWLPIWVFFEVVAFYAMQEYAEKINKTI